MFLTRSNGLEVEEDEVAPEEFVEYKSEDLSIEIKPKVELPSNIAAKFQRLVPLLKRNAASTLKDFKR